jgi:hypothetical protein
VPGTEQLDIFGLERSSTLRVGQDVVKVQFIGGTTHCAFAPVSLPNGKLDVRGDDPPVLRLAERGINGRSIVLGFLDRFQAELENLTSSVRLPPGIHEMEEPVVAPNSLSQLFINPYKIWGFLSRFEILGSMVELAVLSWTTSGQELRLI